MNAAPSAAWFDVFPGPSIPDVLAYVSSTWAYLQKQHAAAVAFEEDETALTDNLCQALEEPLRRKASRMDCDFQSETWELRRRSDGRTIRVARADIRVILGAPGTPHLVIEFKKLDGTTSSRWRYCFDGISRFVEGKYAQGHSHGVMCGLSKDDPSSEATALAAYMGLKEYLNKLCCLADGNGLFVAQPSASAPASAWCDTKHGRPNVSGAEPIVLLHTLMRCATSASSQTPRKRKPKSR